MIRILQIFAILERGGSETMIMNYYRSIDRRKVQFDFLVHRQERGHYDDEVESLGGKIYRVPSIRDYLNYQKALDNFFSTHSKIYNIIHSHINAQGAFILRKAKSFNIPVRIAHSHMAPQSTIFEVKPIVQSFLRKSLRRNSTHHFACGFEAGKWMFGKDSKFEVIPNAIDSAEFNFSNKKRIEIRKKLRIDHKFVIGHVGRFELQKNHLFIIKTFLELTKIKNDCILVLVGDGTLKQTIERYAQKIGLTEKILFVGIRDDISDLLQSFDFFLFPSKYEGLPVTLVEAQCAGLKVMSSDAVTEEVKVTNLISYLSLKEGPKKWALELVKHSDYQRKGHSIEIKNNNFDIEVNAKKLEQIYLNMFNKINE